MKPIPASSGDIGRVMAQVQHDGPVASKAFTLPMMMALPLRDHVDAIIKLAHRASSEHTLELTLEKMTNDVREAELQVSPAVASRRRVDIIISLNVCKQERFGR